MSGSRKSNSVCLETRVLWLLTDHKLIAFTQIHMRKILASGDTADKTQMYVEERLIKTDLESEMQPVQLEVVLELRWFVSIQKYSSGTKKLIQSKLKPHHEFM